jgi:uncharacterized membrane protein
MTRLALAYLGAALTMAALDLVWIGFVMRPQFEASIADLLAPKTNLPAAVLFYLLYVGGIVFFAVAPALKGGGWHSALGLGAMLGLFCYATYDLTNLATLKGWPVQTAALDIAWGIALTAAASAAGYFAASRMA